MTLFGKARSNLAVFLAWVLFWPAMVLFQVDDTPEHGSPFAGFAFCVVTLAYWALAIVCVIWA